MIEALHLHKGLGARRLIGEFPQKNWKLSTVQKFLVKLRRAGSRHRKPGSGRPRSARTLDNVRAVEQLVLSDDDAPGTSLTDRETAKVVGISRSSVQRIVKEDLELKTFKRVAVTQLTDAVKEKRRTRAARLLRKFRQRDVRKICFSDEKIFSVSAPRNSQNSRVRSRAAKKRHVPAENLLQERRRSRGSVMVSLGVTVAHKTSIFFVPAGVKINSAEYQRIILGPMLKEMRSVAPNFVFQQDVAPSHTSRSTLEYLASNCRRFIEPSL